MFFEWLYGIPEPPAPPKPRNENEKVSNHEWRNWIETWCQRLLDKLKNEEDDPLVEILLRMIETKPRRRWSADRCLDRGFDNGLFMRRATDGLVVGARDPDEAAWQIEEEGEGVKTPTAIIPSSEGSSQRAQTDTDPAATIILGNLWKVEGAANSPSASVESSSSGPPTPT